MEIVVLIIVLALVFDFYNGMNDAANSIATVVSTRVLTPLKQLPGLRFLILLQLLFLEFTLQQQLAQELLM